MSLLICDPRESRRLIAERQAKGLDRFDEIWDGVYVMSPLANNEHQEIATRLSGILMAALPQARVFAGCNVSDREEDWEHNYRIPDVAVFLPGNPAKDHGTHWQGGPDWVAEIVSEGDRSREKLDFYAALGTKEVIILDRYPWMMERYLLSNGSPLLQQKVALDEGIDVKCETLALSLRWSSGPKRPALIVLNDEGKQVIGRV